jgi:flagellar basal body-associated protein FliL
VKEENKMQYPNQPPNQPPQNPHEQPTQYNNYAQPTLPTGESIPPPPNYGYNQGYQPNQYQYQPNQYQQMPPPVPPKKGGATLWIVLGLVGVVLVAAVVAVLLLVNSSGQAIGGVFSKVTSSLGTGNSATATVPASNTGGWKTFSSSAGKFSVDYPGTPKEVKQSQPTAVGKIDIYFYQLEANNKAMLYQAGYNDYPADVVEGADPADLLNGALQGGAGAVGGTVLSQKDITLNGFPGKEARISAVSGALKGEFTIRIYLVDNRLYQLMAGGSVGKIDEGGINRFLNSFKLAN